MHVLKPVSIWQVIDSVVIDVVLFLCGGAGESDVLGNVFMVSKRLPFEATCFKCS